MAASFRNVLVILASLFLSSTSTLFAQSPRFLRCSANSQSSDIRLAAAGSRVLDFGTFSCVDGNGECSDIQMLAENTPESEVNFAVLDDESAMTIPSPSRTTQVPAMDSCSIVPLATTNKIRWVGTAVWVEHSAEMLVLDPVTNQILSISPSGVVTTDKRGMALTSQNQETFLPARLEKLDKGYLLTTLDANAIVIDAAYRARLASGNMQKNSDGTSTKIGNLTDLLVAGSDLLAYGSIRPEGGSSFSLGFVHAHIQMRPWQVKDAELLKVSADQKYYLLGHRYIAYATSGIYFLAMREGSATLFKYSPSGHLPKPLKALPVEYSKVPAIKSSFKRPSDATLLFKEIETFRMPVGLYGQGRYIYLLTRRPLIGQDGTEWRLHQIDPIADRLTGAIKLPTSANHLTVVPAIDAWYFLEKDSVEAPGRQNVRSMIVVPSGWISEPKRSPLNESNAELVKCQSSKQPIRQGGSARAMLRSELRDYR